MYKMFNRLDILILLSTIHLGYAVLPSHICHLKEGQKCDQMPYIHKCGQNDCAKQKSDCEGYHLLARHHNSRILTTIREMGMLSENAQTVIRESKERFKAFESQIQKCPRQKSPAEWTS